MFLCIPIAFGCPRIISQQDDGTGIRLCPRCHNVSVISAKSRTWFEFCFVPLVPISSHRIWRCGICNWEIRQGGGFEPMEIGQGPPPVWKPGWNSPASPRLRKQ